MGKHRTVKQPGNEIATHDLGEAVLVAMAPSAADQIRQLKRHHLEGEGGLSKSFNIVCHKISRNQISNLQKQFKKKFKYLSTC